jgi:hypothetical protein
MNEMGSEIGILLDLDSISDERYSVLEIAQFEHNKTLC